MQPGIAAAMVGGGGAQTPSPLLYGASLAWYLDAGLDVSDTAGAVDDWEEQVGSGLLTVPGGGSTAPTLIADSVNGFPGIRYDTLDDRLQSSAAAFDDFWAGSGLKRLVFAAYIDRISNNQTTAHGVLCDKGFNVTGQGGWQLRVSSDGSGALEFLSEFSAGRFYARANGVLTAGMTLLGWIDWDGTRSTTNFAMRLWDGIGFVGVGVSYPEGQPAASATIASDASRDFAAGNAATGAGSFNGNLEGDLLTLYGTKPRQTSQDDLFLRRYLP